MHSFRNRNVHMCAHFCYEMNALWCIVGYLSGALWDLWDRFIEQKILFICYIWLINHFLWLPCHATSTFVVSTNCTLWMWAKYNSYNVVLRKEVISAKVAKRLWNCHCNKHSCPDLTHLPLEKMAAISQMIFSDAFLWMISYVFWLKFHWRLFLRVQLITSQHWFR